MKNVASCIMYWKANVHTYPLYYYEQGGRVTKCPVMKKFVQKWVFFIFYIHGHIAQVVFPTSKNIPSWLSFLSILIWKFWSNFHISLALFPNFLNEGGLKNIFSIKGVCMPIIFQTKMIFFLHFDFSRLYTGAHYLHYTTKRWLTQEGQ